MKYIIVFSSILNSDYKNIYEKPSFTLPLNRSKIADLLNSSSGLVCRILSEFHKDGIIDINGKEITITNLDLLIQIRQNG